MAGVAAGTMECRAPDAAAGAGVPVHELLARRAAERPRALAVAAADERITFGELHGRAGRVAAGVRLAGAGTDVVVGIYLPRSAAFAVGALGVLRAGCAYVPLDPGYPLDRLAFMLEDARVQVVVTSRALAPRLAGGRWRVVHVDDAPAGPAVPPPPGVGPGSLAYLIYTSGSTGRPKGIELTHGALSNLVSWYTDTFAIGPADRATQIASPSFDAAVLELWGHLPAGASVHAPDEMVALDATTLRDWLVAERISSTTLTTMVAEGLLGLDWPRESSLRLLVTGGERLHHRPRAALPFSLLNVYGPSETTIFATATVVRPHGDGLPSIGRAIAGVRLRILDADLAPVAEGATGELFIGGAGLGRGYRRRPDLTAERFVPDLDPPAGAPGARLYRTGDLVRQRPDGELDFVGRVDEQVKIRGFRIEPDEIVSVLDRQPGVAQSAVVAREEAPGDRRLVAYVVPAAGARPNRAELRERLAADLPPYMLPAAFVWLERLPRTPNGKLDRAALPAPGAADEGGGDLAAGPRTEVEHAIAAIWRELLHVDRVGLDDDFLELGGHSLLATQVASRIRERLGADVPLRSLFETTTLAELARVVETMSAGPAPTSAPPMVRLARRGV